jgi:hypothetical protein
MFHCLLLLFHCLLLRFGFPKSRPCHDTIERGGGKDPAAGRSQISDEKPRIFLPP